MLEPFAANQAGGDVDFLEGGVGDRAAVRAAERGEVAFDRLEGGEHGRAVVGDFEFVQVGYVAVAGVYAPDLLVAVVDDHLFALAEALGGDVALPPGQHRLAVLLDLQVGGVELPAGSGWNQTRLPLSSKIIGPDAPGPA